MPNYGELHSPSLRKHNGNMDMHGRRGGGMRMENIMGDPFALATISIAAVRFGRHTAALVSILTQITARLDHCLGLSDYRRYSD